MKVSYSVRVHRSADKEIIRLTPKIRGQVAEKIQSLRHNPRPQDCKLLRSREREYRVDSGEYRILYQIDDGERVVHVFRVRHRREVYKNL